LKRKGFTRQKKEMWDPRGSNRKRVNNRGAGGGEESLIKKNKTFILGKEGRKIGKKTPKGHGERTLGGNLVMGKQFSGEKKRLRPGGKNNGGLTRDQKTFKK